MRGSCCLSQFCAYEFNMQFHLCHASRKWPQIWRNNILNCLSCLILYRILSKGLAGWDLLFPKLLASVTLWREILLLPLWIGQSPRQLQCHGTGQSPSSSSVNSPHTRPVPGVLGTAAWKVHWNQLEKPCSAVAVQWADGKSLNVDAQGFSVLAQPINEL